MNNPYLIPGLHLAAKTVNRFAETVPESDWDTRTEPDRFTFREAIAHLSDWEPILRGRIHTAIKSPGTVIEGIDEGVRADQMKYAGTNPIDQAKLFAEERNKTIDLVQSIYLEDWHKTITHVEKGEMTVADQVTMLLGHDIYHIEHLVQYMKA